MSVKFSINDTLWKKLVIKLSSMNSAGVKIGVLQSSGHGKPDKNGKSSKITMVELAAIHEFGLGQRERSFIRSTFEDPTIVANAAIASARYVSDIIEGKITYGKALGELGLWGVTKVKNRIRDKEIVQGLADSTKIHKLSKSRKGRGHKGTAALIDTGRLINAIQHKVVF